MWWTRDGLRSLVSPAIHVYYICPLLLPINDQYNSPIYCWWLSKQSLLCSYWSVRLHTAHGVHQVHKVCRLTWIHCTLHRLFLYFQLSRNDKIGPAKSSPMTTKKVMFVWPAISALWLWSDDCPLSVIGTCPWPLTYMYMYIRTCTCTCI